MKNAKNNLYAALFVLGISAVMIGVKVVRDNMPEQIDSNIQLPLYPFEFGRLRQDDENARQVEWFVDHSEIKPGQ